MTSILVVCTGNICRSPMAEGFLRAALATRLGDDAPLVSSAGTMGLEGYGATPEGIEAAGELGADISDHVARRLTVPMAEAAALILCMASDHRALVTGASPALSGRTFTLKELVRLLETLPAARAVDLDARLGAAEGARRAGAVPPSSDDDIADPLGQPFEAYRAIAWELDTWIDRLVAGLYGGAGSSEAALGGI
jgi:protein-tyrosine phosphatase